MNNNKKTIGENIHTMVEGFEVFISNKKSNEECLKYKKQLDKKEHRKKVIRNMKRFFPIN